MKLGLLGNFGSGNVGNEASIDVVVRGLRDRVADVELLCVCPHPETAAVIHDVAAIGLRAERGRPSPRALRQFERAARVVADLVRAVGVVRRLDLVVVPGTGILDDFSDGPTGMPYDLAVWSLAARLTRRPFHFIAVGAGPIEHPTSRLLIVLAARLATHRSYRDRGSRDYMGAVGLDVGDDQVVPDLVFTSQVSQRSPRPSSDDPVVGVGLMLYRGWVPDHPHGTWIYGDYLDRSAALICRLAASGVRIHVFTSEAADELAADDCLRLVGPSARPAVVVVPTPRSFDELIAAMGEVDVVAAPRFHMLVAALMAGVPTVALGYAPRSRELAEQAALGWACHSIGSFDPAAVAEDIRQLRRDVDGLRDRLEEWCAEQRRGADQQIDELAEVLR